MVDNIFLAQKKPIQFEEYLQFNEESRGKIVKQLYLNQLANYLEMNIDLWDTFLAETDFVYENFHVVLFY